MDLSDASSAASLEARVVALEARVAALEAGVDEPSEPQRKRRKTQWKDWLLTQQGYTRAGVRFQFLNGKNWADYFDDGQDMLRDAAARASTPVEVDYDMGGGDQWKYKIMLYPLGHAALADAPEHAVGYQRGDNGSGTKRWIRLVDPATLE